MRFFIVIIICFFISCSQKSNSLISKYTLFLEEINTTSEDYVISLFKDYDIVILCERDHAEITQYEFISRLISSDYFINNVGNIFIEIGSHNWKSRIDSVLLYSNSNEEEANNYILNIQRAVSSYPLWSKYSYYSFLKSVYNVNKNLDLSKKIKVYPLEPYFEWSNVQDENEYFNTQENMNRDSLMAFNTFAFYSTLPKHRKKVLIIQNHFHAFASLENVDGIYNYMYYLKKLIDIPIANVFIHNFASDWDDENYIPIQNGKWDAAFSISNKSNVGFNFHNTPFGKDNFDLITDFVFDFNYQDIFTGMIYLPLDSCEYLWGIPGIIDESFMPEIIRRHKIVGYPTDLDSIMNWYNILETETYLDYCPNYHAIVEQYMK